MTNPIHTNSFRILFSTGLILVSLAAPVAEAAKIKCWTNSEGIRECGNVLPPEYAQKGHEEVNQQGLTVKRHERALNKDELAERARIKAEKEAAEQALIEQKRKDHILLSTFASEDEITMTRDGKITTIKTEIRLTRKSLAKAKDRLLGLRKKAANQQRNGNPVNESLKKEIIQAENQIASYKTFIQSKIDEQSKIVTQYDTDLKRYQALRNPKKAINP